MRTPRPLQRLIESFEKLPGIGPKTAQRLSFYLLHVPQEELESFANALQKLKIDTKICSICKNIGETDPCEICDNPNRDSSLICVVETPLDVLAIEKTNYKGLYHVLHGVINPLQNIGPDELFINELVTRVKENPKLREIILATNPNMEGETTAFYIAKIIERLQNKEAEHSEKGIKITRIGRGLPTGASLEYADETTLSRALEGRTTL